MENKQKNNKQDNWWLRNMIAIIITVLVVGGTVYIAIFILKTPELDENNHKIYNYSFIGQTLLPLWGTWLGTVLAFYFGKANFEAASAIKNVTYESKMASLNVKDVMIPLKEITYLDYNTRKADSLEQILADKDFEPYNRFAVFDKNNVVKAIINRGTFYEFMHKNSKKIPNPTLEQLLQSDDENIKSTLSFGFGFVKVNATLLDAKKVLDSIAECQNVFVTQNGNRHEPVQGLITNNKIIQLARL